MNTRVYLLLDILEEKSDSIVKDLKKRDGVIVVDPLEGHPNLLVIVEAPDRYTLVDVIMPVLNSIERVTNDLRLLLTSQTEQKTPLLSGGGLRSLPVLTPLEICVELPLNSLPS